MGKKTNGRNKRTLDYSNRCEGFVDTFKWKIEIGGSTIVNYWSLVKIIVLLTFDICRKILDCWSKLGKYNSVKISKISFRQNLYQFHHIEGQTSKKD